MSRRHTGCVLVMAGRIRFSVEQLWHHSPLKSLAERGGQERSNVRSGGCCSRDDRRTHWPRIVKKLRVPFSTVSRVIWSLTEEGGDIGIIRYQSHPTDRRKKLLVINERNERSEIPRAIPR